MMICNTSTTDGGKAAMMNLGENYWWSSLLLQNLNLLEYVMAKADPDDRQDEDTTQKGK